MINYGPECVGLARKEAVHFLAACAEEVRNEGKGSSSRDSSGRSIGSSATEQAFRSLPHTLIALIHENMNVELK